MRGSRSRTSYRSKGHGRRRMRPPAYGTTWPQNIMRHRNATHRPSQANRNAGEFKDLPLAAVGLPVGGEEGCLADRLRRDRAGHPGEVDEVACVDVLGGDVAAPGAAGQAQREREAVARAARSLVE